MLKKILGVGSMLSLAIGGFIVSANGVGASAPSATSTLDTIMTVIINTTVSLATTIFTNYWPYILVFGIIAGLVAVFAKFVHLGGKK
jgi:phage-related minor tail protein